MKKAILGSLLILASTSASASCYKFVNERGPEKIGNFAFAAKASGVCINTVHRMSGDTYTSVRLFDQQGDLAVAGGQASGSSIDLNAGNINGENVDLNGAQIQVQVQQDPVLGISKGVLSIQAGRDFPQQYLIISSGQ